MPTRTHDATAIVRLPTALLARVDALRRALSPPGADPMSRSNVLRAAVSLGVDALETHGGSRPARKGRVPRK